MRPAHDELAPIRHGEAIVDGQLALGREVAAGQLQRVVPHEVARIARLVAKWIAEGWCLETIFNLKLPMKKRFEEALRCRQIIDEALGGHGYFLRMKQLFHDREEITAYLARR